MYILDVFLLFCVVCAKSRFFEIRLFLTFKGGKWVGGRAVGKMADALEKVST